MLRRKGGVWVLVFVVVFALSSVATQEQSRSQPAQQGTTAVVAEPEAPRVVLQAEQRASVLRLMKFSGVLKDRQGNPRTGLVGVTFNLYTDQQGGSPLWLEVHNAQLDEQGRYTVLLGSTQSEGLPLEMFSTGEARWLGVQANLPGEEEQPRVLLVSVPYALKAADAETLGGKPPSAFLLAEKREAELAPGEVGKETVPEVPRRQYVVSGTVGRIAKFVGPNPDDVGDSSITETGGGSVGLGTGTPAANLHVLGTSDVREYVETNSGLRTQLGAVTNLLGFVGTLSGRNFSVRTGDMDRIHIVHSTGSVGMGMTSPAANLHVRGTSDVREYVETSSGLRTQLGAVTNVLGFVGTQSGHDFSIRTGDIGIGTPAPTEKVHVQGNIKISGGGNGIIFPDSTVQTTAGGGDITAVVASTGLTGGATSGTATLELSSGARARGITYLAGCDSCGALADIDDQKTFFQNVCDPVTINSVTCFSDAGSPVINIQRQVGVAAPVNVLSPDLTCSTTGASGTIVGAQSILNTGDKLDFVTVTAGGTAKRVTVVIKTTMN